MTKARLGMQAPSFFFGAWSSRAIPAYLRALRNTERMFPLSRHEVTYPSNGVRECYTRALEERGLTEECFSSSTQKSFKLGGAYRR